MRSRVSRYSGNVSNDQSMLNYWGARFFPVRGPRTWLYPMGSATLGYGAPAAHLVDDAGEVDERWLDGVTTIGVTSGASVPEELVAAVLDKLAGHGFGDVEEVEAVEEHMTFALPRELRPARPAGPGSRQPG